MRDEKYQKMKQAAASLGVDVEKGVFREMVRDQTGQGNDGTRSMRAERERKKRGWRGAWLEEGIGWQAGSETVLLEKSECFELSRRLRAHMIDFSRPSNAKHWS